MGIIKFGQNINNRSNIEIIVVDDDNIVLDSLKTLFEIENIKNVRFFNSPIDAFKFLKDKNNKHKIL